MVLNKCYYEVLGISKTVTAEEIKKAYKVKALQLHPDKNRDRLEEATQEFAYLQQCYTVLSDPHERKWYDNHRDAILRSGPSSAKDSSSGSYTDEDGDSYFDLMPFFNSSAYKGFNDGPKGFYTVFRKVFEDIETEERRLYEQQEWSQTSEESKTQSTKAPLLTSFGYSTTAFLPGLQEFYKKWTTFQTLKLFHGAEKYGSTSGYSRDQRRYIEKENKKLRDAKRKEYSDTVRSLAMYLKKRDPRYLAWKRATEEESAKEKSTNNCNKKQSYQSKTSEMLPEWAQINEADYLAYFKSFRASESESEEIEVQEDLNLEQPIPLKSTKYVQIDYYCEACRKSFKSESQWSNHEKSNKHFKCIKELKRKFRKEEKMLKRLQKENKDNDLDESSDLIEQSIGSDEDDQELLSAESEDEDKNEDEKGSEDEDEDEKRSEDEDEDEKRSEIIISEPDSDVDLETLLGKLEIERQKKLQVEFQATAEKNIKKKRRANKTPGGGSPSNELGPQKADSKSRPSKQKSGSKPYPKMSKSEMKQLTCKTCKVLFDSRNALFKHIKLSKHAAYQ